MTAYNTTPFGPPPVLMVGGKPEFLYGAFDDRSSGTTFIINNVSLTSNVATITGVVTSGNVPVVGAMISIEGTSSNSGAFNVTNVAIASATINASTGAGTITFPLTHANVSSTADVGIAAVPQQPTYEAIANGSSRQVASAENDPSENDERSYMAQVFFGTVPTACTVTLQASLVDQDSAYQTVGTVATVSGSTVTQNAMVYANANFRFLRFNVSGLSGSGTIAAAILG